MTELVTESELNHYKWGDNCDGWHLVKTPMLSVIKERVPSGCSETRHYHQKAEQFFFVLSGVASLEVAGTVHSLAQQEGLHIPAGVAHQLCNEQDHDLVFLVTSVPPSHGDRVDATLRNAE